MYRKLDSRVFFIFSVVALSISHFVLAMERENQGEYSFNKGKWTSQPSVREFKNAIKPVFSNSGNSLFSGSLQYLDLSESNFRSKGSKILVTQLSKSLQRFSSSSSSITSEFAANFSSSLQYLDLSISNTTVRATKNLTANTIKHLQHLDLSINSDMVRGAKIFAVKTLESIQYFGLENTKTIAANLHKISKVRGGVGIRDAVVLAASVSGALDRLGAKIEEASEQSQGVRSTPPRMRKFFRSLSQSSSISPHQKEFGEKM
ncbi:MAG: hypothetical protein ACRCYP_01105 [Alphaproteobacteria bacterium]